MRSVKDILSTVIFELIIISLTKGVFGVIPTVQPFSFPAEVTKGQSVTVICAVLSGTGPFNFRWTNDGEIINDHPPFIKIQNQDELSLLSLRSTDRSLTGNYTCIVSNDMGSGNFSARLMVYEQPEWSIIPDDVQIVLGNSVRVDCVANGAPQPNITWKRLDGQKQLSIPIISRHKVYRNGSLLLQNVRAEDTGDYECIASNNIGEDLQKKITVHVHIPPLFREDFQLLKVRSSHSTALQCEVTGDRPLVVKWTKEYLVDNEESRQKFQETPLPNGLLSELYITRVTRQDAGLYVCVASNPFGQRERTVKLVVLEPPSSPSDIVVKQIGSDEVTIRWSTPYSGNSPVVRYILQYWKDTGAPPKLEEEYAGHDKTSAVLSELRPGTPYVVRLVAENEFGQSTPSIPVKFITAEENPSGYPTDLTVEPKGPNSIIVRWKPPPPEQRNGLIKGYDLGYRERRVMDSYAYQEVIANSEDGSLHQEHVLDMLQASTEYEIVVRAFNTAGRGPLSVPAITKTGEQGSLIAPTLWIESTSTSTISLRWSTNVNTEDRSFYYKLYYRVENGSWRDETLTDPSQDSFLLSGLEENTVYEIFLQTVRGQNRSNPSAILKASTSDPSASMRSSVSQTGTAANPSMTTLVISLSVVTSAVVIVCVVAGACVYVVRVRTRSCGYKTEDMGSRHLSDQRSASESMRMSQAANYRYVDVNSRPLLWCSTPAPPANDYPSPYATLPLRCTPLSKRWQSEGEGLSLAQSERSESLVNQRVDQPEEKAPSSHD